MPPRRPLYFRAADTVERGRPPRLSPVFFNTPPLASCTPPHADTRGLLNVLAFTAGKAVFGRLGIQFKSQAGGSIRNMYVCEIGKMEKCYMDPYSNREAQTFPVKAGGYFICSSV